MDPSFQKQLMDVNGLPHKSIPVIIPGEYFKINEKRSISNINQTNLIVWHFYEQTWVIYLSAKTRGSPELELKSLTWMNLHLRVIIQIVNFIKVSDWKPAPNYVFTVKI